MQIRLNRSGAFAALLAALTLSGCANPDVFDSNERWFSRPFDWSGSNAAGYSFAELKDTNADKRPVTAKDLVSPNGACPPPPATAAGTIPDNSGASLLLGQAIAVGMTECDVVYRAGAPSSVQLSSNARGDRVAVLTYDGGSRSGIYRFEAGRLVEMDRLSGATPEPQVAKRAKKKPPRGASEQISTE